MEDLIKRSDAIKAVKKAYDEGMKDCPTYYLGIVPAVEPKQGEWIETSEGTMCGNCHKFPYDDDEYHIANWHSDYCPNCGARMKGADNE